MYPPLHEGKYQEEQEMVADKSDTPINRIGETHLSEREGQRGWIEAGNEPSTVSKEKSGKLFRDVFSSTLRPFCSRFRKRGPAFVRREGVPPPRIFIP